MRTINVKKINAETISIPRKKTCNIKVCDKPLDSKGLCHGHYERMRLKRKKPMEFPLRGWGGLGIKAFDINDYQRQWRKIKGFKSIRGMHKMRFGGLREQIILRDREKCVLCNMTREQHNKIFDRDLTINHIDHQSRRSANFDGYINNDLGNLETLCLRCHGAVDAIKHGKYSRHLVSLKKKMETIERGCI